MNRKKRQEVAATLRKIQYLPTSKTTLYLLNNAISIDIAVKGTPNERLSYFIGKEETMQPKMRTKPSTLLTLPILTGFDLARLIFKSKTTSKHKNKQHK